MISGPEPSTRSVGPATATPNAATAPIPAPSNAPDAAATANDAAPTRASATLGHPPSRSCPASAAPDPNDLSKRHWALVEALADHWGWHPADPEGKVVYAAWNLPDTPAAHQEETK